jgi:hypothetical protein
MKFTSRITVVAALMVIALFVFPGFEDSGRASAEVLNPNCVGSCQAGEPLFFGERCVSAEGAGACACNGTFFMGHPLFPECNLSGYGCYGVIVS